MRALEDEMGKTYLGDGVYADFDEEGVVLTTEGGSTGNVIYLEPEVIAAMVEYLRYCGIITGCAVCNSDPTVSGRPHP